ncbi:MAG: GntR family transcriptional regulator [Rubrimonas sp.]|uniref:GntR family transcriptional regulator n=1 Tax=Rubrimonas sp. TaxID=2036015 RepID=UPI002FDC8775
MSDVGADIEGGAPRDVERAGVEKRADALRDALEDEILTGRLAPGARLEEVALARRFGVSRTPIREALLQLSASGLTEYRPRRGASVAQIGPRRLGEMFEVMADLEAMAARLAARRAGPEDVAAIREAHEACARAAEAGDGDAYYYENERFHDLIRRAGRNGFLAEQADALQKRLRAYRRLQLRARGRIEASFAEHETVMEAIARGDETPAAEAMRAHVAVQGERFADLLASLPTSGATAVG